MSTFAKVFILGTLGVDPSERTTREGRSFCRLSLAVDRPHEANPEERRTEWHSVHLFDALADRALRYLKKGEQVWITGRLQKRKSLDADGKSIWQHWITADELRFMGRRAPYEAESREELGAPIAMSEAPQGEQRAY